MRTIDIASAFSLRRIHGDSKHTILSNGLPKHRPESHVCLGCLRKYVVALRTLFRLVRQVCKKVSIGRLDSATLVLRINMGAPGRRRGAAKLDQHWQGKGGARTPARPGSAAIREYIVPVPVYKLPAPSTSLESSAALSGAADAEEFSAACVHYGAFSF
jgi:hypothetical protein